MGGRVGLEGGDDEREPPQIYASSQIEIAWTVTPSLIPGLCFPIRFLSLIQTVDLAPL